MYFLFTFSLYYYSRVTSEQNKLERNKLKKYFTEFCFPLLYYWLYISTHTITMIRATLTYQPRVNLSVPLGLRALPESMAFVIINYPPHSRVTNIVLGSEWQMRIKHPVQWCALRARIEPKGHGPCIRKLGTFANIQQGSKCC